MFKKRFIVVYVLLLLVMQPAKNVSAQEKILPPLEIGIEETTEESTEEKSTEEESIEGERILPPLDEASTESELPELNPSEEWIPSEEIDAFPEENLTEEETEEEQQSRIIIVIAAVVGGIIIAIAIVAAVIIIRKDASGSQKRNQAQASGYEGITHGAIEIMPVAYAGKMTVRKTPLILTGQLIIGSDSDADILFENANVEPMHAKIELTNDVVYLVDLSSGSGTYLEGMRIQGRNKLQNGDVISVGSAEFRIDLRRV